MAYFAAGPITAAMLEAIVPRIAVKLGDETVSSNTTTQTDDALLMPVAASTRYAVDGCLFVLGSGTTGDLKTEWSFPTGAVVDIGGVGLIDTATTFSGDMMGLARINQTTSPTATIGYATEATGAVVLLGGHIIVSSTAGTLQLRWAQIAASGTTTLKAGSWLRVQQIVAY